MSRGRRSRKKRQSLKEGIVPFEWDKRKALAMNNLLVFSVAVAWAGKTFRKAISSMIKKKIEIYFEVLAIKFDLWGETLRNLILYDTTKIFSFFLSLLQAPLKTSMMCIEHEENC